MDNIQESKSRCWGQGSHNSKSTYNNHPYKKNTSNQIKNQNLRFPCLIYYEDHATFKCLYLSKVYDALNSHEVLNGYKVLNSARYSKAIHHHNQAIGATIIELDYMSDCQPVSTSPLLIGTTTKRSAPPSLIRTTTCRTVSQSLHHSMHQFYSNVPLRGRIMSKINLQMQQPFFDTGSLVIGIRCTFQGESCRKPRWRYYWEPSRRVRPRRVATTG